MLFIRMLAKAFEIVGSMGWDIVVTFAFAFRCLTKRFLSLRVQVLMLLESMIAETFSLRSDHFALNIVIISPAQV